MFGFGAYVLGKTLHFVLFLREKAMILQIKIPKIVEVMVAISEGKNMLIGAVEFALIRNDITEVGRICREVADKTINVEILSEILPSYIFFIAFMPIGVDAFPSPNRFAETFIAISFSVSLLSFGNKNLRGFLKIFARKSVILSLSKSEKSPSQKA